MFLKTELSEVCQLWINTEYVRVIVPGKKREDKKMIKSAKDVYLIFNNLFQIHKERYEINVRKFVHLMVVSFIFVISILCSFLQFKCLFQVKMEVIFYIY